MKKVFLSLFLGCLLLGTGLNVYAREPYHVTVVVGPEIAKVSEPNIIDMVRELKTSALEEVLPFYTPVTPVLFDFNLRGIDAIASYAANSTTLNVQIPQLGINESFSGATRDDSLDLFRDFLKNNGNNNQKILKNYAKLTAIDPIAGNPNSLMSQMAQSDYSFGRLSPLAGCSCCWSSQPIVHQFQLGLNTGRAFADEFDTTLISLPLRYSYSPCLNWAFILDAPMTLIKNGGAYSVFSSLGFGFRIPIIRDWSLTPTLRAGVGGSADLTTGGAFVSAGLTSNFGYPISNYVLTMTNYAGYFSSTPLHLGGINFDYHLHNYIFKNGVVFTTCNGFEFYNRLINFNMTFTDTVLEGDPLFIEHYDEVGVALIINGINPYLDYDCLSLGISYQFGQEGYKGYYMNLLYQF